MKCSQCGAKMKQLFSSSYCPNDCDKKKAVSNKSANGTAENTLADEIAAANMGCGFKCGDKVRIIGNRNNDSNYNIGDKFYFSFITVSGITVWLAKTYELSKNGKHYFAADIDEIELVT